MNAASNPEWVQLWDQTFAERWEQDSGKEQTNFFARIALACMPEPLIQLIRQQRFEILDWGCALGDALPVFAEAFPDSVLTGLDVSSVAVAKASQRHPEYRFTTTPLGELGKPFDLVYTSNCLEHFEQPLEVLRQEILPGVKDYLIILVPYLEINRCPGHLVTFDIGSFPAQLEDMGLLFSRAIATTHLPKTSWYGQQILLVYARRQARGLDFLLPALQQWQAQGGK